MCGTMQRLCLMADIYSLELSTLDLVNSSGSGYMVLYATKCCIGMEMDYWKIVYGEM